MNPFMAPAAHSSQIAEVFFTDAPISLVMYLCRASSALPALVASTFHNRSAFGLPSSRFSVSFICFLVHLLALKIDFGRFLDTIVSTFKIITYLMRIFKAQRSRTSSGIPQQASLTNVNWIIFFD